MAAGATASANSSQRVGGNADVVVPPALVGASDGLAGTLTVGKSYQLAVHVWLAAGQPRTSATVMVSGAQVQRCDSRELVAGEVVAMRCRVIPAVDAIRSGLVVTVDVGVHAAPTAFATFTHSVLHSG